MPRVTGFVICAALFLLAGAVSASTGADLATSARLLPDSQLRVAMLEGLPGVGQQSAPAPAATDDHKKSYGAVIPMSFLLGFGSGHFYTGATWRGLKYLAYDLVAIGLDIAILLLSQNQRYDMTYTWVVMGIVFGGNRIFQTIDAAQTVNAYNKGLDVSASQMLPAPGSLRHVASTSRAGMRTVFTF